MTRTSEPVPGALDAQGDTFNTIDDMFLSIKNMFPREGDPLTYSSRFSHVPDTWMIVEAAVGLAKTLGPEVRHTKIHCHSTYELNISQRTLIRRGLDNMIIYMEKCREFDDDARDPKYFYMGSHPRHHEQYRAFRRALCDTARDLQHSQFPTTSVMVLETIHAMWILSVIIRFSRAREDPGNVSLFLRVCFRPMLRYFETTDMTLDELCDDVYQVNRPGSSKQSPSYWGQIQIRNTYLALDLYRRSISGPTGIDGSGPTVAKIIGLLNEIVNRTWQVMREEASKHCSLD